MCVINTILIFKFLISQLLSTLVLRHSYHSTYNHLTNVWNYAGLTVPPARPPTCRLRWDGAASFLALCWPSPRAWASSSSNSCCRVSSAESEQPGKNQSSSISFVPQGKGECRLDWGCIYGWEAGIKWAVQNDGGVKEDRMTEMEKRCMCWQMWCFDEEGDEALSTPQMNFVT